MFVRLDPAWEEPPMVSRHDEAGSPVFIFENRSLSTVSLSSQSRSLSSTVIFFYYMLDYWLSKFFFENLDPGSISGRNSGYDDYKANSSSNLRRFSSLTCSILSRKNYSMSLL